MADEHGSEEEGSGSGDGLRVREEIADALAASLRDVTTQAVRVRDAFAGGGSGSESEAPSCELLCDFARAAFAQACVDAGVLVVCDAQGRCCAAADSP